MTGAVAFLSDGALDVRDMPVLKIPRGATTKRELDAAVLSDWFGDMLVDQPHHAFVERVGAMPGQGVSGVFAFGKCYGIVLGILAALEIPVTLVSAAKWKKALSVPASKDGARLRASQLMPQHAAQWARVKDHGRAEAALIALWGSQHLTPTR